MKKFIDAIIALFSPTDNKNIDEFLLKKGEEIKIVIPEELLKMGNWTISKWNCEIGDLVKPGDVLCTLKSGKKESSFEAFLHGKINYRNVSSGTLVKDSVIVEIVGVK